MEGNHPIFELKEVSFRYAEQAPVLDGLSFQVAAGQSVAVLGANGCGKSTLLSLLDGLLFPTAGHFEAFGRMVSEEALEREEANFFFRSRVAYVFQNPDVQLFCPTVRDEVCFGPLQLGLSKSEALGRTEQLLALLEMTGIADRAPYSLSGGEKKRVAIAVALATNPEVLLLDEPGNGLDPRTQAWLVEFLQQLSAAGKTIVTATHDLSLVDEIAERVVVLDESHRLAADGRVSSILEDQELLLRVNLIHEHYHHHGAVRHRHRHGHLIGHRHFHEKE